jgi:hypothetical protein
MIIVMPTTEALNQVITLVLRRNVEAMVVSAELDSPGISESISLGLPVSFFIKYL